MPVVSVPTSPPSVTSGVSSSSGNFIANILNFSPKEVYLTSRLVQQASIAALIFGLAMKMSLTIMRKLDNSWWMTQLPENVVQKSIARQGRYDRQVVGTTWISNSRWTYENSHLVWQYVIILQHAFIWLVFDQKCRWKESLNKQIINKQKQSKYF